MTNYRTKTNVTFFSYIDIEWSREAFGSLLVKLSELDKLN